MKFKIKNLFLALASAALLCGCFTGCASLDKNADPIEVRAEQTIQTASDLIDTFIGIEFDNQALIKEKVPAVHEFAEYLRQDIPYAFETLDHGVSTGRKTITLPRGLAVIESARDMRLAYKVNRTAENKANLQTAIAVALATMHQVEGQLAAWSQVQPTPAP